MVIQIPVDPGHNSEGEVKVPDVTVKVFCSSAVYPDGRVCISILHAPGDDPMGYESSAERWSPVQSVEKILLSVVSMLAGTGFTDQTAPGGRRWN